MSFMVNHTELFLTGVNDKLPSLLLAYTPLVR